MADGLVGHNGRIARIWQQSLTRAISDVHAGIPS
jgi:hypothetical protein